MTHKDDPLDEILLEVYSEGIHNTDGKRGMKFTIDQAKAEILKHYILKSEVEEALKDSQVPSTHNEMAIAIIQNKVRAEIRAKLNIERELRKNLMERTKYL